MLGFITVLLALCLASLQYYWLYITLINRLYRLYRRSPVKQQLTALPKLNLPISFSGSNSSLTSSTRTHPITKICKFQYVSMLSHKFSSCSTASPIFLSNFLHARFIENTGVAILRRHIYRRATYDTVPSKLT